MGDPTITLVTSVFNRARIAPPISYSYGQRSWKLASKRRSLRMARTAQEDWQVGP